MLNSELFEDPKDLEIAKLKLAIKSFKKYDRKRNQLIFNLNKEIKELMNYINITKIFTIHNIGKIKITTRRIIV